MTALVLSLLALPAFADKAVPAGREQLQLSYAPLVRKVAPAVVNIYSRKVVRSAPLPSLLEDPVLRRFFGDVGPPGRPSRRVQNSLGSGVVVDASGLVVTSHHVVAGADEITVVLADRREFEARIIGSDERTDLAVLRVETGDERLPVLELRDSDAVEVGDLVLAIGNPFGVGQTVTSGIVSAVARTGVGVTDLNVFIQTDAAINPGNSGGALVDMSGGLIGINAAIFSKTGGSLGIGFAIPSNMVRTVVAGLAGGGRVVRPWLGAWGQELTADTAEALGLKRPAGLLVRQVYPGGPADRAGVRIGDVVLAIAGHDIENPEALRYRLATLAVGSEVPLRLWRRDRELSLQVTLIAPPDAPARDPVELSGRHPLSGARIADVSPALAEELGDRQYRPGVVIVEVKKGTTASRLGFRGGDRIVGINARTIESVDDLKARLARAEARWQITVERGGRTLQWVFQG
jgi:serine protease Do